MSASKVLAWLAALACYAFAGYLLLKPAFTYERPASVITDTRGNECRQLVRGLYLPCNQVEPRLYPQEWYDAGEDV